MLRLGEKQTLTIVKRVAFGVYLAESKEDEERVLLPGFRQRRKLPGVFSPPRFLLCGCRRLSQKGCAHRP